MPALIQLQELGQFFLAMPTGAFPNDDDSVLGIKGMERFPFGLIQIGQDNVRDLIATHAIAQFISSLLNLFQLIRFKPSGFACIVIGVDHVNKHFVHAHHLRRLRSKRDVVRDVLEHFVITCSALNQSMRLSSKGVRNLRQYPGPETIQDLMEASITNQTRVCEIHTVPVMVAVPTVLEVLNVDNIRGKLGHCRLQNHVQILREKHCTVLFQYAALFGTDFISK